MTDNDLKEIENRFYAFTNPFAANAADPYPYTLKQEHTIRVCDNIHMLAQSLDLVHRQTLIAAAAAMVHDMGRFPQFKQYGTYSDARSKNHGALGVATVAHNGILKGLSKRDRRIILRAVALHNRARLPKGLNPDLDLIARLLRDADKIDIFRVMKAHSLSAESKKKTFITHNLEDDGRVPRALVRDLVKTRRIDFDRVSTLNDMKIFQIGMVYDLNFSAAIQAVREQGVIRIILDSMPASPELDTLNQDLSAYMKAVMAREYRFQPDTVPN